MIPSVRVLGENTVTIRQGHTKEGCVSVFVSISYRYNLTLNNVALTERLVAGGDEENTRPNMGKE